MDVTYYMVIATIAIVLIFDYTNGFHDAANIVATPIASRAMKPIQAVVIVGTFEFLGPLLGGTAVANTIGKFINLEDNKRSPPQADGVLVRVVRKSAIFITTAIQNAASFGELNPK